MRSLPAAVLWDMDGTLVDTEPYWFAAERDLVESYGHQWSDHDAHAVIGFDLIASGEYIREHGHVPLSAEEIVDRLIEGVLVRIRNHIRWRPGALELLAELNEAGIPCALVTMSWRRLVEPIIAALPANTFVAVIVGDEVEPGRGKPQPDPYLMGAAMCGVVPRDCVAIEDSPTGVLSALRAGCVVLGVPNMKPVDPARGVRVVDSLVGIRVDDLTQLLQRRNPPARRKRPVTLVVLAVIAAILAAATMMFGGADDPVPAATPLSIDAWVPYWALDESIHNAASRLDSIREISPFWFGATSAAEIVVDEFVDEAQVAAFVSLARSEDVDLIPSIRDRMESGAMAAVLADPATRSIHIAAIVDFARRFDADGIDIDYEQFAFADSPTTWEATSRSWVVFVAELANALHAGGRSLTVSVPPVYDVDVVGERGFWVYALDQIAPHVDAIRIMAYDYSVAEPGPIAPLAWVAQVIEGVTGVVPVDMRHKLVLGIPSYGTNWVVSTQGVCPVTADGRTSVTAKTVGELATLRGAVPMFDEHTGEWSFSYDLTVDDGSATCVQSRRVHWVDAEGVVARTLMARDARWGGVSLWALGYETEDVWRAITSAVSAQAND